MNIGIMGAPGTGKTTLAMGLQSAMNLVSDNAVHYVSGLGVINKDKKYQDAFESDIIRPIKSIEFIEDATMQIVKHVADIKLHTNTVSDGTFFDLATMLLFMAANNRDHERVSAMFQQCLVHGETMHDVLFVLPYGPTLNKAAQLNAYKQLELMLLGIFTRMAFIGVHTKIIPIQSTIPDLRIKEALQYIAAECKK